MDRTPAGAVRLPLSLRARLDLEAAECGVAPGEIVAHALDAYFRKGRSSRRARSGRGPCDERLLALLRSRVARALDGARGWDHLQERLAREDLAFAPAGGGLILTRRSTGARLCKGSEAGPGYAALIANFGSAFPGHGHVRLAHRTLDPVGPQEDDPVIDEGDLTEVGPPPRAQS